ncbi:glutathione peroxidase [Pseudopedobacter beijingensis]|uniref:Glutathione peroxidase n=1 Tax=Pseudopedobacter beijingensis TaxID=1207056 RepID=A0ABW4IH06_9SPHI
MENTIYQFRVRTALGLELTLDAFKDKVLMIVNTASECGFTPQLEGLAKLKEFFKNEPFEILAFPSNDFGGQEPLEDLEVVKFCETKYKTNFPVFSKIKVRGQNIHPLYSFLSNKKQNGKVSTSPKWNFHKYLINQKGQVVDFFYPFTKPDSSKVRKRIKKLFSADSLKNTPENR